MPRGIRQLHLLQHLRCRRDGRRDLQHLGLRVGEDCVETATYRSHAGSYTQECHPVVNHVNFIWNIAESLRGPFKPSEYGSVVLPFTVLRRLDAVLADTKAEVLKPRDDTPACSCQHASDTSLLSHPGV
jgi:hypothetical protein